MDGLDGLPSVARSCAASSAMVPWPAAEAMRNAAAARCNTLWASTRTAVLLLRLKTVCFAC